MVPPPIVKMCIRDSYNTEARSFALFFGIVSVPFALISALAISRFPWIPLLASVLPVAFSAAFAFSRRASLCSAFSITAVLDVYKRQALYNANFGR